MYAILFQDKEKSFCFLHKYIKMENNMKAIKVVEDKVNKFADDAQLTQLYLFGGSVLDPLLYGEKARLNDYDLCVKDEESFFSAISNLKKSGYKVSEPTRAHNVYVVIHDEDGLQFDFACMDPEDNGIFSLEKVYARFPQNEVVDKYDSLGAIKRGELRIASNPKKEGVYNLLRRFIAVSSKYDLPIFVDGPNQETIDLIKKEFKEQPEYIFQDKVRCLDRLVKTIAKRDDKSEYIKDFSEQGLLKQSFPSFHNVFSNEEFRESEELKKIDKPAKLLQYMLEYVSDDVVQRDGFVDSSVILEYREEARSDADVINFVKKVYAEKTSISRLNNKILSPLLSSLMAKEGASK